MAQLTEEQHERVRQIRERQEHNKSAASDNPIPKFLATAYTDIDFLLSLLDSDSRAANHHECERRFESMLKLQHELAGRSDETCARLIENATTAMRDKCVEKVKAWLSKAGFDYGPLVRELELLTSQEQENETT